ncbi:MAG: tRNA dihydrouridine synthase DusB [Desulfobacterales bacterium]|nr:tRNA dihydrouridine synthase DusB [Desulfobacterales bacterium]
MKIGSVSLQDNTVLAPLAGITNLPFRLMIKQAGCGLVCAEMVSANGLIYGSQKTVAMLATVAEEKPVSIQIFGSDSSAMAEAARRVESAGATILDINFGCSVKKVVKTGAGVALMKTPEIAEKILTAVRQAITIPLTIKIRTGWEPSGQQALEIARIAEGCGVDAIAVHSRTATQGFRGTADRSIIRMLKAQARIPIIGNGDILCAEDALSMMAETGCDGVMIGRAAMNNPLIFNQINALLQKKTPPELDLPARFGLMESYFTLSVRFFGELHACRMMRSRLGWFVKGLHQSSAFRESIKQLSTKAEGLALIRAYRETLERFAVSYQLSAISY